MIDLPRRPTWMARALCPEVDNGEVFFPEKGTDTGAAKRICQHCPVQAECLEYALDNQITHGIWGGLNYRSRSAIRRVA